MKVKFSDMANMIAQEVIEQMTPLIRKIVKEEVNRGARVIIKENRNNSNESISDNVIYGASTKNSDPSYSTAKQELARRAHNRARSIVERTIAKDDPYADLIMSAEDPMIEEEAKSKRYENLPMIESTEVLPPGVQPEQIDFSAHMEKMGL